MTRWVSENVRFVLSVIALGSILLTGTANAVGWYVRKTVAAEVTSVMDEFRTEWRCSEWRDELTEKSRLLQVTDESDPEHVELTLRIERLRALIVSNECARYDT